VVDVAGNVNDNVVATWLKSNCKPKNTQTSKYTMDGWMVRVYAL